MRPESYRNLSGDSGVTQFAIGAKHIAVQFDGPAVYMYDYEQPGKVHVERMKVLAAAGRGLGTYISQHIQSAYAEKRAGW